MPAVISPQVDDLSGPDSGRTRIMSSGLAPLRAVEDEMVGESVGGEDLIAEDQARQPRLPHDPGRPTKQEIAEHCVRHWPFRSWCRHCVCGRAVSKPHRSRSDEDRKLGREIIPSTNA